MKKIIILPAIVLSTTLFVFSAKPDTVTSSTAVTFDEMQNEMQSLNDMHISMPTMPPMPSLDISIPSIRPNNQFQIPTENSLPTPHIPTPTEEAQPTQTPVSIATSTPKVTATPIASSIATTTPELTQKPNTPAPTKTPTQKPATTTPQAGGNASFTDEVINLVNQERAKVNLGALTKNSALTHSAQNYAAYMANENFFSHTGEDGSTFITRNKAAGYSGYRWMGENIAAGQSSPQEVMNGWMASSGHKANILNAKAKEIGVGYATNGGSTYKKYWVQEFGAR